MAYINGKNILFSTQLNNYKEAFYAFGSDYAVCFEWADGNPTKENRNNRFVQLTDGGTKISFATENAYICGVTTDTAAFVENYGVNSEHTSLVGILGIVTIIDNGACAVGGCCMSDENGYAVPSTNNMGYRVMARVDETKIKIAVKPNDDMIQRIRTDVSELESKVADLLYKAIEITSFTNDNKTVEKGKTITKVVFSWDFNRLPDTLQFEGNAVATDSKGTTLNNQSITNNKTFTLYATDERGAEATKTTSISFVNGVYTGKGTANAAISSLTKSLQSTKSKTFTVTAGANEYIFYACPTSYGTPVFSVGGFEGGFSKVRTEQFTNDSGYTESYDVWRSDKANLGATTVVVK